MKLKRKKGFTLVELLVVIAILAILAAVSVVGYLGFTKKANLSNDQSMVTQMNTGLQGEEALNGKFEYAADSINALNSLGFNGKYNAFTSGHYYGYSLENNRMYLVDGNESKVIFPETSKLEVSDLWFLWNNDSQSKVKNAKKYISMVNIDDKSPYFKDVFVDDTYSLDLGGHYINVENSPVKVSNGIVINGVNVDDNSDVVKLDRGDQSELTAGATVENKVFDASFQDSVFKSDNITYNNCFFYNFNNSGFKPTNQTFENCTFIDSVKYVFNLQGDSEYTGTLNVRNSKFINCDRVFNLPLGIKGQTKEGATINIVGNEFYGVVGANRSFFQFNIQKVGKNPSQDFAYTKLNITDNKFYELSTSQAGIVTLHESIVVDKLLETFKLDNINFANNEVSREIDENKYIVNDDGKLDSQFDGYCAAEFKKQLTEKFKAGSKLF